MKTSTLVAVCATLVLFVGAPSAKAGDVCAIHRAVRDGNAVKILFDKGFPPAAITRRNGSKTFINTGGYKPPDEYVVQNPHAFVILRQGDKLGIIGMDSGCIVTVIHGAQGELELKMSIGIRFVDFMPAEEEKNVAGGPPHS